jgi:energy-converting hydrogenase A subunit M
MNITEEQQNNRKVELINDLMSVATVIEEIWNYHPDNPNKKDVVSEYNQLLKIKGDIENELEALK